MHQTQRISERRKLPSLCWVNKSCKIQVWNTPRQWNAMGKASVKRPRSEKSSHWHKFQRRNAPGLHSDGYAKVQAIHIIGGHTSRDLWPELASLHPNAGVQDDPRGGSSWRDQTEAWELWVIFILGITFIHGDGIPIKKLFSEEGGTSQSNPKRNNPSLDYRRGAHPIYRQALITAINGALIGTVTHDCQSPVKDWRVERRFGNRRKRRFSTARVGFAFKGSNSWVQWGVDAWITALGINGWLGIPIDSEDLTSKDLLKSFESDHIRRRWESRVPSAGKAASLASARSAQDRFALFRAASHLVIDAASHPRDWQPRLTLRINAASHLLIDAASHQEDRVPICDWRRVSSKGLSRI